MASLESDSFTRPTTPRTSYARTYFTKPIVLKAMTLFQVPFDISQFRNYKQITADTNIECFIQTLFSLGLRDIHVAKEDIEKLTLMKRGTPWTEATKYIEHSFGLDDGQVSHEWLISEFVSNKFSEYIKNPTYSLSDHYSELRHDAISNSCNIILSELDNDCATILLLIYASRENYGHYIIASKRNNNLLFFDPQKNKFNVDINTLSENPIIRIGVINVRNITTPVELKTNTCSIAFNGGKSRKRRRTKRNHLRV